MNDLTFIYEMSKIVISDFIMLSRLATRQRLLVAAPKMCRLTLVARPITPTQMVQKRQLSVVQWLRGEPLLEQGKFFFCKKGKRDINQIYYK